MDTPPKDRRLLIVGGAVAAVVLGTGLAFALRGRRQATEPQPQPTGLVVKSADSGRLDPAKTLHCFVAGQLVGDLTLSECARRNGVAAGALDVGVDANGQLGAATDAGTIIAPLPPSGGDGSAATGATTPPTLATPAPAAPPPTTPPPTAASVARAAVAICWRYDNNAWTRLPGDQTLNGCVQTLYAGRCERAGAAAYGRWGEQTLRLIPRRVEISADNRSFRTLVEQGPDCSLAAVSQ